MSIESEFDLDKLFLPSWVKESPSHNKYADHPGERTSSGRPDRRGHGGPPGGFRPRGDGPRRDGAPPRERRPFPQDRRPEGENRPPRRDDGRPRFRQDRREDRPLRPAPIPLPELDAEILPAEKGVESIARQIKMTGRAYPMFEIALLILEKPERQQVRFEVVRQNDKVVQPLFLCMLDETLWLSEEDAVNYALERHFATFYQTERTQADPPKGTFTFVAQCGMSGAILGPPNYHDYQTKLRKLHQERFSRMPFEEFKSRVKIVRDEAVVKKWVDDLSWKTEFVTLNLPEADVKRLQNRDEVAAHFRQVHAPVIIKPVDSHVLSGVDSRKLPCQPLQRLVRVCWDDQRRFPLKIVNHLSQHFAKHGLQFFKVNKQFTHVSVARPHFLDLEATPVSEGIRKIVEFTNAHPRCSRRDLVEGLAPSPAVPAEDDKKTEPSEPTPEQTAIIADLHWLVHQGHVIEFANGTLETAKKPKPKPEPKPETKSEAKAEPSESVPVSAEKTPTGPSAEETADSSGVTVETAQTAPVKETPSAETAATTAGQEPEPAV